MYKHPPAATHPFTEQQISAFTEAIQKMDDKLRHIDNFKRKYNIGDPYNYTPKWTSKVLTKLRNEYAALSYERSALVPRLNIPPFPIVKSDEYASSVYGRIVGEMIRISNAYHASDPNGHPYDSYAADIHRFMNGGAATEEQEEQIKAA